MKIIHDMPNMSDETEHGMYNKWKWKSAIWLRFTQRSGNFLIPKFWLRKILCDLKRQSHQFLTASFCRGAGIAPVDLTTLSSLRARRTFKTVVKRKLFTSPIDPFVTSDVSDAQNCGKMQILAPARATLSSLRTCRTLKTVEKCEFLHLPERPFRHFGRVGRSKLW